MKMEQLRRIVARYPEGPLEAAAKILSKNLLREKLDADEIAFLNEVRVAYLVPPRDVHKHKCVRCDVTWEHETPPPSASEEDYRRAHLCPKGCGADIRLRFEE